MLNKDSERLTRIAAEAVREAGVRAVFSKGWGGLAKAKLPSTILQIESAPHSWLFQRVSAAVHHGGIGTTGASLRAGLPAVICPVFGDQFFNGEVLQKQGLAAYIPQKDLTVKKLAKAIDAAVIGKTLRKKAVEVSLKIEKENGVENAVKIIERHLS